MFILRHTNQDKDFKKSLTWREFEWKDINNKKCRVYIISETGSYTF